MGWELEETEIFKREGEKLEKQIILTVRKQEKQRI